MSMFELLRSRSEDLSESNNSQGDTKALGDESFMKRGLSQGSTELESRQTETDIDFLPQTCRQPI